MPFSVPDPPDPTRAVPVVPGVTGYLLPSDGDVAQAEFLKHLGDPGERYIIAFAFTLVPMIDLLVANHDRLHVYLDNSQSSGAAEKPLLQRLVRAGVEVTIGTSTAGSQYICHSKAVVCQHPDGTSWCWEGSVNFSLSGWHQVNTVLVFDSKPWADAVVAQFLGLRQFAWTTERADQLMPNPPPGVTPGPVPVPAPAPKPRRRRKRKRR